MSNDTLTALPGVRVGHSSHPEAMTGCTVVRFDHDIPVACALYGGATASYHTDELQGFSKSFPTRDALFIAGGSRVGLAAAAWAVVSALSEQGVGLPGKVPLPGVSGAIIYDLGLRVRAFNPAFAREALDDCSDLPVARGNVGAGVGATVGKLKMTRDGLLQAMKAGVGCARIDLPNGAMVCALSVVNARGNVIAEDGSILAGNRDEANAHGFISFEDVFDNTARPDDSTNTTVTIVGTNVKLPAHEDYQRVAHLALTGTCAPSTQCTVRLTATWCSYSRPRHMMVGLRLSRLHAAYSAGTNSLSTCLDRRRPAQFALASTTPACQSNRFPMARPTTE